MDVPIILRYRFINILTLFPSTRNYNVKIYWNKNRKEIISHLTIFVKFNKSLCDENVFPFLFKGNSFRIWLMPAITGLYLYFLILEEFQKYKNILKAFPVILKKDKRWSFIGNHIHDDRHAEGNCKHRF